VDELRVTGTLKPMILSFDGRVIEVFGSGHVRYHLELIRPLELTSGKHGHVLTVGDVAGGPQQVIPIDEVDFPSTAAFVNRVNAGDRGGAREMSRRD
jgi:hypothetical protein